MSLVFLVYSNGCTIYRPACSLHAKKRRVPDTVVKVVELVDDSVQDTKLTNLSFAEDT